MNTEVKIDGWRYEELLCHERECEKIFKIVVLEFIKKWREKYPFIPIKQGHNPDVEKFINDGLQELGIVLDNKNGKVSFNMSGSLIYFFGGDTKVIDY